MTLKIALTVEICRLVSLLNDWVYRGLLASGCVNKKPFFLPFVVTTRARVSVDFGSEKKVPLQTEVSKQQCVV